jgi:uncharacterized DUF497 family protein
MALVISNKTYQKLSQKHGVSKDEILQCFANRYRGFLEDIREEHLTDPPSKWFVAETDYGRKLKVVFIQTANGDIHIKTAYLANAMERQIYDTHAPTI